MADRREQERREGKRATSHNWGDDSGRNRNQAVKLANGVQFYSLKGKEGKQVKLNFVNFVVGKENPMSDPGFPHFERRYFVHQRIGPNEEWYACPLKIGGRPCPVCEYLAQHRGDKELFKSIGAKQRHIFAVFDPAERDKGVQVLESGFHMTFGEMLCEETASLPEGDSLTKHTALCRVKKDTFQGRDFNKISKVSLIDREADPKLKVKEVPCLDDFIVELPYEKLKKLFLQTAAGKDSDDEDEDERPVKRKPAARQEDDNDEPLEDEEDEDVKDDDDDLDTEEEDEEPEEDDTDSDDEDEEEDEPAQAKKGTKKKPSPEPEEEDEDEDEPDDIDTDDEDSDDGDDEDSDSDDEEEPPPKKKKVDKIGPVKGKPAKKGKR